MAGDPISALPAVSEITPDDLLAVVQNGVTSKATINQVLETLSYENACRLATTGALTASYNNGSSGVGATLTNSGVLAAFTIDGVLTVVGDRILVKNQATQFQNGIYEVTVVGDGATAWVLTRTLDYDDPGDIDAGDFLTVAFGTVNAKTQWIQTQVVGTIGLDNIIFESNIVAGAGITKTNNTISVTGPLSMALGGTGKALVAADGGIVYTDVDSMEILAPTVTAGQILRSGSSSAPSWSTATFSSTYAINDILYASSANTIVGLTTVNSAIFRTSSTGVPGWTASLTDGQLIIGSTGATPVVASLTAGTNITITPGAGSISIGTSGMASITWTLVSGTTQSMTANSSYVPNNAARVVFTLPVSAAIGDVYEVAGRGAGGWRVGQNVGQQIFFGASGTTSGVGGYIESTNRRDCVRIVCVNTDVTFTVTSAIGALTVV